MRRINYGNREKYIAEEEILLRKKGINWDRVVYLIVLLILVVTLIIYLSDKYFYLTVDGQVVNKNHVVYLSNDAWIDEVYVEADEFVEVGDSLFLYRNEFTRTDNDLFNSIQSAETSKERDLANARRNLIIKETEYKENLKLIASYQEEIDEIELMVLLDAYSSDRINSYEIEIDKINSSNEVIMAEVRFWRNYIANIPQRTENYQNNLNNRISDLNQTRVYYSSFDGQIDRVNYEANELVYKGQPVLDFVQDELFALCYLSEKDFGLLLEDEIVSVKFSDGQKSEGIVRLIFANNENIPPNYRRNNSAPEDYYLVIIEPTNKADISGWEENINQRMKVTKSRRF